MYSPFIGRFAERDPIESDANLYRYCGDSPVIHVDPSGLFEVKPPAPQDKVETLRKAETEAKKRMQFWVTFFAGGPDELKIQDELRKLRFDPNESLRTYTHAVNHFAARLRVNTKTINEVLAASSYQVRFPEQDNGNYAESVKYTLTLHKFAGSQAAF